MGTPHLKHLILLLISFSTSNDVANRTYEISNNGLNRQTFVPTPKIFNLSLSNHNSKLVRTQLEGVGSDTFAHKDGGITVTSLL